MDKQSSLLAKEQTYACPLVILTVVLTISGYATYFWQNQSTWVQWTYILHTLIGIAVSILLLVYVNLHFRRTIGYRRPGIAMTGFIATLVFGALIMSGLHIAIAGQSEAKRWIFGVHIYVALFTVSLLILHVVFHSVFLSNKRKKSEFNRFPSLTCNIFRATGFSVLAGLLFVSVATILHDHRLSPFHDEPAIKPYTYSYGTHPFRPSQTETVNGGFYDARRIGSSERCATCHQDIAQQWQASIHSQAGSDKAYQTNIKLLAEKRGMDATRYCEGCHVPAALLSGQLTKGGKLDTINHMHEGVSCMGCHGIDRVEHVKGVASFRFAPPSPYLFEGDERFVPALLHNFVLRLQPAQHKADLARDVLAIPELCATCHAQFMDKDFNGWGWVKMQDDYTAWLNGPYSGQTRQTYAHAEKRRCQDCHFPLEPGNDPSANQDGLIKTHFNIGANTAIPSLTGNHAQLSRTIQFLESDKVRINLDRPNRTNATESTKHINPDVAESGESPTYFYLGEVVNLKVAVTNAQVGHAFPGGTTDINEAWIHFMVSDSQGQNVYESGFVDPKGDVDSKAYFYKSTPIDRNGNVVWRHDLFNMIGDSFKRIILPGGTDVTTFSFTVPDWVKGPLTVSADLNYRKLNNQYAKWALKDGNIRLPIVTMSTGSIKLPIRIKPDVTSTLGKK